jgi:NAD(P)-dependent dehydrogenase (short-subunit alcohol dehydrogenase family)
MSGRPIAVITGGARGIGRQIAADLITRGYRVVIGDLDEEATRRTAAELGSAATAVRLDITDRALVAQTIEFVEKTIGPIAVWVNNAGIMPTGAFAGQDVSLARAGWCCPTSCPRRWARASRHRGSHPRSRRSR